MKIFQTVLLCCLGACAAQAAEAPAVPEVPAYIKVFKGQWLFLYGSTNFCAESVPAMKREFERAREYAEEQMDRAEATISEETARNREGYKPLFEKYTTTWIKYAGELVAGIKKQDPRKACPDLLSNWKAADADVVLEDWHGFLERSDPVPDLKPAEVPLHGGQ